MQIQTAKTQEMNLLREQQEALTSELSQRRAEYEGLSAQRDDLASQLQVRPLRAPGAALTFDLPKTRKGFDPGANY